MEDRDSWFDELYGVNEKIEINWPFGNDNKPKSAEELYSIADEQVLVVDGYSGKLTWEDSEIDEHYRIVALQDLIIALNKIENSK